MRTLLSRALTAAFALPLLFVATASSAQTEEDYERAFRWDNRSPESFCRNWLGLGATQTEVSDAAFVECREEARQWIRDRAQEDRQADERERLFRMRPAEPDSDCTGAFTHFTRYGYEVGGLDLAAIRVTGSYRLPSGAGSFSVIDDDGFFTIASVVSRWQSVGPNMVNIEILRVVPRSDLELVHTASVIGAQYYDYILGAYTAPRAGQSGADFAAFRTSMTERRDYSNKVSRTVSEWLTQSPGSETLRIRESDLSFTIMSFLEIFNNPAQRVQYVDLERPSKLYALCQDGAANPAIGQLVCSRDFLASHRRVYVSGASEHEPFCPKGILIAPLPRLCDESAGANCQFGAPN